MSHHGKNPNNGIPEGNLPHNGGSPEVSNGHEVASPAEGGANPTHRTAPVELQTQTSRPTSSSTVHRGDRRDTHPSFSTGKGGRGSTAGKAPNGGRSGPLGASGRKSGPQSD